jgi:hypothetical protein
MWDMRIGQAATNGSNLVQPQTKDASQFVCKRCGKQVKDFGIIAFGEVFCDIRCFHDHVHEEAYDEGSENGYEEGIADRDE